MIRFRALGKDVGAYKKEVVMTTEIWIYLLASGFSERIPLAIETNSVVTSCNIIMIATITSLREGAKE